jgi:glutamyl-tRNA synthetase
LHVGGARTALFNWLFARQTGGIFVLRIEDTDRARSSDEHTKVIHDGLLWLGIQWNEGPFFQADFADQQRALAERLLAEGKAYRCFCSVVDLAEQRQKSDRQKIPFTYDRRCYHLSQAEHDAKLDAGTPFAIRFLMPGEEFAWDDAVHGRISFHGRDLDDFVILRSDGSPIYNLAVVADDLEMGITHVIRGADHISNTPKQVALYRALDREPPVFAHVPMILGTDGKKLSKRHGATAVGDYQEHGILPAALRNFLALLGWSPGDDREILTEREMIDAFSLEAIQKKPAVFDPTKLEWMNGQYLSMLPAEELLAPVRRELARMRLPATSDLHPIIDAVKTRSRTVLHLAEQVAVRLDPTRIVPDTKATKLKQKMGPAFTVNLGLALPALEALAEADWNPDRLVQTLRDVAEANDLTLGEVMQPIRVALTGSTVSEPVNELLFVVGRDSSLSRLRDAGTGAHDA